MTERLRALWLLIRMCFEREPEMPESRELTAYDDEEGFYYSDRR